MVKNVIILAVRKVTPWIGPVNPCAPMDGPRSRLTDNQIDRNLIINQKLLIYLTYIE